MPEVKVTIEAPVAVVTLNRPQLRNALSPELVQAFQSALDSLLQEQAVAALVVTGAGRAFSAGADLRVLRQMTEQAVEEVRADSRRLMQLYQRVYEFPKPVIAAVNGPALAGGCGLASVCDLVFSVEEAVFGYPEVGVGFIPALVSVFLLRICGEKKARELLLTGRIFSAREAEALGLVNQIVPPDLLLAKARETAEMIAANSPAAVTFTKELLRDLYGLNLDRALAVALGYNTLMRTTEDFKEGVSSFLEKRPPVWKKR